MAGPVGVEELSPGTVGALIGVGSEVVTLGLEHVGRQPLGPIAVIVLEGGSHRRCGDSVGDSLADDVPPSLLSLRELALEIRVEQDVGDVGIPVEGFLYLSEEYAADDALSLIHI